MPLGNWTRGRAITGGLLATLLALGMTAFGGAGAAHAADSGSDKWVYCNSPENRRQVADINGGANGTVRIGRMEWCTSFVLHNTSGQQTVNPMPGRSMVLYNDNLTNALTLTTIEYVSVKGLIASAISLGFEPSVPAGGIMVVHIAGSSDNPYGSAVGSIDKVWTSQWSNDSRTWINGRTYDFKLQGTATGSTFLTPVDVSQKPAVIFYGRSSANQQFAVKSFLPPS